MNPKTPVTAAQWQAAWDLIARKLFDDHCEVIVEMLERDPAAEVDGSDAAVAGSILDNIHDEPSDLSAHLEEAFARLIPGFMPGR